MPTAPAREIACLLLVAALAGCAAGGSGTAVSGYGAVTGGPGLALLAAPAPEAAVGEVAGQRTPLASDLAALLEPRGKAIAERAQHQALEESAAGVTVNWRTPDGGARGTVVPGPIYAVNAQTCRDFTHEIELAGQRYGRRATACRDAGGGWALI